MEARLYSHFFDPDKQESPLCRGNFAASVTA
ncbi:hypothetical protein FHT28_001985 [Rhizobium sp. SG570]|nr:hypothetical protein [Rhizobium sp. SG570]